MYFYQPKERQTKEIFPRTVARTFWGERVLLSVVDMAAGVGVPAHRHPHEQAGMVLEGEIEMRVADQRQLLRQGDVYVIPGNVEHQVWTHSRPARVLDVFSPVREEYKY